MEAEEAEAKEEMEEGAGEEPGAPAEDDLDAELYGDEFDASEAPVAVSAPATPAAGAVGTPAAGQPRQLIPGIDEDATEETPAVEGEQKAGTEVDAGGATKPEGTGDGEGKEGDGEGKEGDDDDDINSDLGEDEEDGDVPGIVLEVRAPVCGCVRPLALSCRLSLGVARVTPCRRLLVSTARRTSGLCRCQCP